MRKVRHSASYLRSHLRLLTRVAYSEVKSRFAGSVIGIGWWALTPLLLLAIYAPVYLFIFKVQAPDLSRAEYVVLIFTGLVPFLMTSEALLSGVSSIVVNRAVLANTVFPIDLVPIKAVMLSQITLGCGLFVILVSNFLIGRLTPFIVLFPVIWLLHMMFLVGVLWFLSLINLIFRDLQNIINIVMMYLMIASPIAYTPEMVPNALKPLVVLNPLAHFILAYQDIVVFGRLPDLANMAAITILSLSAFVFGGMFFARAKGTLIDHV